MANLISQWCGETPPVVCLSRGDRAICRTPEHSWTSDKSQKQATAKAALTNFQHQYLSELVI